MGNYTIKAYHGTIEPCATEILAQKKFKKSEKTIEWLGFGIYFFQKRNDAIWWSTNQEKRKGEPKAVLCATLCCDSESVFDLDCYQNLQKLRKFSEYILDALEEEGKIVPHFSSEKTNELRCFWCNAYKKQHPEVQLMAYTFESQVETGVGFNFKQRQLCASSDSIISHIERETIK